ncbi:Clp protease N-terminal domain-containing protein [Nocardia sp. NPDC050712]|uniref:Clp protease N-terminal domain-containing protein n=1 Tax=Nocardia sp. NPDC050712 TaxID=3155518 RepID=UPI003400F3AE
MTTTARPSTNGSASPDPVPPLTPTRIDGWITPDLELVLQRAVDIADTAGHRQLRVEHVALAMLEDSDSGIRSGWNRPLTAAQWQAVLFAGLPAHELERKQTHQVTDIFCWRSVR